MAGSALNGRDDGIRNSALGVVAVVVIAAVDLVVGGSLHLGLLIAAAYLGLVAFLYRSGLERALLAAGMAAATLTIAVGALSPFDGSALLDRAVYAGALVTLSVLLSRAIKHERDLKALSTIDALTGALHEPAFVTQIAREAIRVRRYRTKLSIIMAEIDNFQQIQKSRGAAADDLLASLAKVCLSGIRPTDLFGRSGNRLLIAMPETTELGSSTVAERLRSALSDPALLPEGIESFDATVSYGISWVSERDAGNPAGVIARAARALTASQSKGPGSISTVTEATAA